MVGPTDARIAFWLAAGSEANTELRDASAARSSAKRFGLAAFWSVSVPVQARLPLGLL